MPQKYEREIEEILRRFDDGSAPSRPTLVPTLEQVEPPKVVPIRRAWRPPAFTASGLMIAALALAVLSAPMQHIYAPAVAVVGLAAAALLIASLVLSVSRWSTRPERTWRGRPIEQESAFSATALRRRWRRWKAHRRFRDPRWN